MILLNRPQQGGDWVCAWPLGRCVKSAEGSYRRGRFRQRSLLPARAPRTSVEMIETFYGKKRMPDKMATEVTKFRER